MSRTGFQGKCQISGYRTNSPAPLFTEKLFPGEGGGGRLIQVISSVLEHLQYNINVFINTFLAGYNFSEIVDDPDSHS